MNKSPLDPSDIWNAGKDPQYDEDTYINSLIQSARRFFEGVEIAQQLHRGQPTHETLVLLLMHETFGGASCSTETARRFAEIRKQVDTSLVLTAQYEALQMRYEGLQAQMTDPLAHFLQLSGYKMDAIEQVGTPALDLQKLSEAPAVRGYFFRKVFKQRFVLAALTLFGGYFSLRFYGNAQQPLHEKNGVIEANILELGTSGTIGGVRGSEVMVEQKLKMAGEKVNAAHKTTLGLFPRCDKVLLESAIEDLKQIIATAEAGDLRSSQAGNAAYARYFLGKAYLSLGNKAEAKKQLEWVKANSNNFLVAYSRNLLKQM